MPFSSRGRAGAVGRTNSSAGDYREAGGVRSPIPEGIGASWGRKVRRLATGDAGTRPSTSRWSPDRCFASPRRQERDEAVVRAANFLGGQPERVARDDVEQRGPAGDVAAAGPGDVGLEARRHETGAPASGG